MSLAIDKVVSKYPQFVNPDYLFSFNETLLKEAIRNMLSLVMKFTPESSPGVPYSMIGNSNAKVIESMGEQLVDIIYDRFVRISKIDHAALSDKTDVQLIDEGYCDPVRVFVKDEPHKVDKLATGRVRLIHSVSLVDKVIEMLLIRHATKGEIQKWRDIPSKPGIGFDDESNQAILKKVRKMRRPVDTDLSGYDMSVKAWLMYADTRCNIKLCKNPSLYWENLMWNKTHLETRSIFQFSDGTMVRPNFRGIVNSGKFKTSYSNSKMRVLLAELCGEADAIAAGDDCIEDFSDLAEVLYGVYGFKLKGYKPIVWKDGFEFCSHFYSDKRCYALNAEKMIMNFLHHPFKSSLELRMQMAQLYAELGSHPEWPEFMARFQALGLFESVGAQIDGE